MSKFVQLRRQIAGQYTDRPFWTLFRTKNPGYSLQSTDSIYKQTIKCIISNPKFQVVDNLCEIGSDLGRSTAWLSSIALNIDVYEQDTGYIDLCKLQCLRHQEKYGPITNVNWYDTGELNIIEVLNRLNRKYDCIKITTLNVVEYVPTLLENLKQGGFLLIQEYGGQETKAELVKVLQRRYDLDIRRLDLALFVAEHK